MAKMPDVSVLGQRPVAEPGMGVVPIRGATGAETAMGEAVAQVGRQLGVAANEWGEQLRKEKAILDRTRAEDAFNKLEDTRLELQQGQDGLVKRRGEKAIDGSLQTEYGQRFDTASKEIAAGLSDEEQRRLFQLRSGISRRAFSQFMQAHVSREDEVYRKQVYESGIDTTYRAAVSSWNNAADVQAQLVRMQAIIDQRGQDQSLAPEVVSALKAEAASRIHAGVIGQALAAEQTGYAKQWYDRFKGEIDPQTAQRLFKQVEDEGQKTLFNGYNRVLIDNVNDRKTLSALERTVSGDEKLDDGRKNSLLMGIRSKIETLDRRAEMAQMRWERQLEKQIDGINKITLQGFEVSAEQMAPLIAATKGTAFEPQVRQMVAVADATRKFRLSSPREQEVTITAFEQEARKDPTKFDITVISRFKSIYESQQKAVRDDPITFATRQGIVAADDPSARPLDMSKPELLGPQLAARAALGRGMQGRYGSPLKVLTKEESDQLVTALRTAPAEKRAQYLGSLSRSLSDDPAAYRAVLSQIRPDDPVTALAGARAADNVRDAKGRLAADLMLRGQEILNPPRKEDGSPAGGKLWPMPKMQDMETQFRSLEKDAMRGLPQMHSDMQQAAYAIYAAKTAEAGDTTAVVDSKRMRESFELAIGQVQRWNGNYTLIPHWSTPGQFKDAVKQRLETLATTGQLDPEQAKRAYDLPLELAGEGRYRVRSGDAILKNKQGQDVIIDIGAPGTMPPVRGGSGAMGETKGGAATGMVR